MTGSTASAQGVAFVPRAVGGHERDARGGVAGSDLLSRKITPAA